MYIDVNVSLSRWPARRLPGDEPARLVEKLRSQQVTQAWAGSFDALLHRDLSAVNARLAATCREHGEGLLIPFGTVNPSQADWQEDLRRCVEDHRMRGLRLFPNYHQYPLDEPAFEELLKLCDERRLVLQIAVSMEDDRTQHPLMRVPAVDVRPLAKWLPKYPKCRIVLLNAMRSVRSDDLSMLMSAGDVSVEIAALEGVSGIEKLLQHVPHERILFGSHYPFFYFESALLKMRESELAGAQHEAIARGNAQRLLENKT